MFRQRAQNPWRRGEARSFAYSDQALDPQSEPPLGAHLVTPRFGFTHHGIYVGRARVVQYRGLSLVLRRGPVEEVTLSQFAQGHTIYIRRGRSGGLDPEETVRRARLRLGEDRYRVLTNNCEHFCEWCAHGEHRSYQVDRWSARWESVYQRLTLALGRLLFLRQRAVSQSG